MIIEQPRAFEVLGIALSGNSILRPRPLTGNIQQLFTDIIKNAFPKFSGLLLALKYSFKCLSIVHPLYVAQILQFFAIYQLSMIPLTSFTSLREFIVCDDGLFQRLCPLLLYQTRQVALSFASLRVLCQFWRSNVSIDFSDAYIKVHSLEPESNTY